MATTRTSTLTMENVRCFSRGKVVLRPLTIFLGENSTGKTTTLACHQAAHNLLGKSKHVLTSDPFNQYPHSMGSFKDVFRISSSQADTAANTKPRIILTHEIGPLTCTSSYVENVKGMIELEKIQLSNPHDTNAKLEILPDDNAAVNGTNGDDSSGLSVKIPRDAIAGMNKLTQPTLLANIKENYVNGNPQATNIVNYMIDNVSLAMPNDGLVSIPERKPSVKRSYVPDATGPHDENDEVPLELIKLREADGQNYREVIHKVNKFGKDAKMFEDFSIVNGDRERPSYELVAKRKGRLINIHDMGTGVWPAISQVIAAELESLSGGTRHYHFQHIEKYSHPRLHAELVKWLCGKIKEGNDCIVETHSEHVLMRLAIEIHAKRISPEDVSVVYFENEEITDDFAVHNLNYDEYGTVVDIPDTFQQFYYEETRRYISTARR